MKLTILLPVGSLDQYASDAIKSTVADMPIDSELLICATENVILELHALLSNNNLVDDRIVLIKSKSGDIVSNLNSGLEVARGTYIARMDADDLVIPGRFSKQIDFLEANLDCAVVGTYLQYICQHGNNIGLQDYPMRQKRNFLGLISPLLGNPSVMMRHDMLISAGGYNHDYPHVEDLELWLRLSRHHDLHNLPIALLKYRLHPNQTSRTKSDDQLKYGLLAFINDARQLSQLAPLDTKNFEAMGTREFLLGRRELLNGLVGARRAIFSLSLQEKFLERYFLEYLHSVPPRTLFLNLLVGKTPDIIVSDILGNLPGFALIALKIVIRRLRARLTIKGRQTAKSREASTKICPLCLEKK